jgi:DNA-binding Lrp family transcriptional regulator
MAEVVMGLMQPVGRQVAQDIAEGLDILPKMRPQAPARMHTVPIDELDARIVELFTTEPRVGVLECSRRLGVARGTVQARLDRMSRDGVVRGWGPQVDPAALGYAVTAFVTLEIRQHPSDERHPAGGRAAHDTVAEHLAAVPEVLEAHTITGPGDVLARVVARSNADLQRVIDRVLASDGVVRASTVIALDTQIRWRLLPLVADATRAKTPST